MSLEVHAPPPTTTITIMMQMSGVQKSCLVFCIVQPQPQPSPLIFTVY